MTATAAEAPLSNLRFMVRAFRSRNYRLFFGGQIVSLIGTWVSTVASSWLVYRLASSDQQSAPLMLGLVGFASQFPIFLFTPFAGVLVDRWNRHTILVITQSLSMLTSFALAVLTLGDWITIHQLMLLGVFQGFVGAVDAPARQSFTIEMVESRDDLSNAIALSSSMMHSARLIGPAMAGYLIYAVGEGYCFLIDGVSYVAVLTALLAMRLKPHVHPPHTQRALAALREGFRYAFGFGPIRDLVLLVAITSVCATSVTTLMPVFAAQVLGGQERTLGILLGASGLGAVGASLYLATRRTVVGLGRVIAVSCWTLGFAALLFAASTWLAVSAPLLIVTGFCLVAQMASTNTVLQTIVDDDKRGRVMSLYAMAFLGMAPLGSLLAGWAASWLGVRVTLSIAGCVCLVAAAAFTWRLPALRPLIRPIYVRKGILPEMAEGLRESVVVSTTARD